MCEQGRQAMLSSLSGTTLATLKALKALPKLEKALDEFLASSRDENEQKKLEKKVKPLLLDAGAGRAATAEILVKWKNWKEKEATEDKPAEEKREQASGLAAPSALPTASEAPIMGTQAKKQPIKKRERAMAKVTPDNMVDQDQGDLLASHLDNGLAIKATSQESRFHTEAIDTETKEIDLKDVTVAIEERMLLDDAHLRIKEGMHYGLVGRNGTGKSTLLKAMADRIIPGLPNNVKILLVSQLETEQLVLSGSSDQASVLEAVLSGDRDRANTEREAEQLGRALDSQDEGQIQQATSKILLQRAWEHLEEARKISSKRSGTRGAQARKDLLAAEDRYECAKKEVSTPSKDRDWQQEAVSLHAKALSYLDEVDASTAPVRARQILTGLGFSEDRIMGPYTALSGGWRSRLALASALLQPTHVLLLDEPVNFLDLPSILWLQSWINECAHSVVVVAHDVEFLNSVAQELIILRKSKLTYFDGNLAEFEATQRANLKDALRKQEALDKKRDQMQKSIADNAKQARKTGDDNKLKMIKSRQRKLDDRWGIETNAKGHRFKLNRDFGGYHLTSRGEVDIDVPDAPVRFAFPDPPPMRHAGSLLDFDDVTFAYPGKRPVLSNVKLTVDRGERVALVGPNGHGKTTLVQLAMGSRLPTRGSVTRHTRLRMAIYAQDTATQLTSCDVPALQHFMQEKQLSTDEAATARGFLAQMGLRGPQAVDALPARMLSGGQKVRLGLAMIMWDAPDLVILDEVTTHLDSDTIEALVEALSTYEGAVILISHDRHAVKRIVERKGRRAEGQEEDEDGERSDEEESQIGAPGRTYLVQHGKLRLLEAGVQDYVQMVERQL